MSASESIDATSRKSYFKSSFDEGKDFKMLKEHENFATLVIHHGNIRQTEYFVTRGFLTHVGTTKFEITFGLKYNL